MDGDFEVEVWMGGGGSVAQRTNSLITQLINGMLEQDAYRISQSDLNDLIRRICGVDGPSTKQQYRERVVRHGPFYVRLGHYYLDEEYRK